MDEEKETDFELYLQRYMTKHKLPRDEAIQHKLVQEAKQYYEEKEGMKYEDIAVYN